MNTTIEQMTPQSSFSEETREGSINEHSDDVRPLARFITHYTGIVAAVLELATLLIIVAFRRTDFVIGAAIFGVLAIVVLMGAKGRIDSSTEVGRPRVSRAR